MTVQALQNLTIDRPSVNIRLLTEVVDTGCS